MSDKLRAAAEAALEFAEFCWRDVPMNEFSFGECNRAIDQLRAALAEPPVKDSLTTHLSIIDSIADHLISGYVALMKENKALRDAAPPRREWQSLTNDEIDACWKAANALRLLPSFTEQIQAKLKEKNYG